MDENKPASSWDDLLKEIGANPTSDAAERRRPAIENTFDPPTASKPPAPKAKPGNWNALASDLGIEVPAEPAPPARAEVSTGPGAIESTFAGMDPFESEFEDVVEDEIADIEFSEGDSDEALFDDEDDDSSYEEAEDGDEPLGDDEGDALPPSALSGEAARSAFEALFQAGSGGGAAPRAPQRPRGRRETPSDDDIFGESDRPASRPKEPRPERPSRAPRESSRGGESRGSEARSGQVRGDEDRPRRGERRPPAEPVAEGEAAEGGSDEARPRRRRRRGGRGRGRSPQDSPRDEAKPVGAGDDWQDSDDDDRDLRDDVADVETSHDEGDEADDQGDRPRRRRSRRGRGRSRGGAGSSSEATEPREAAKSTERRAPARNGRPTRPPVDHNDDDEDDDDGDDVMPIAGELDDDDAGSGRSAHKSIPSWSEAIGVMVDVNMQARKNSPQRPSSRGGGGGRGRGRGGRGRGGGGRRST